MMDPNQPNPYAGPYQAPPRPAYPYSKPWQIAKIVLTSFSIVFCIIVLGISIGMVVDPDFQSFQIIWIAPQACIAICWSTAELITICARRGHLGIHPAAHVALHLLLWLGFITSIGLNGFTLAIFVSHYNSHRYSSYYGYENPTGFIDSTQALLAFLSLLVILHFTLFVRACVETAQRKSLHWGPVFMVQQPMYYSHPMGQYQMPPNMQQSGFPTQPQQAHLSGYQGQPKEAQQHASDTGTSHLSQPTTPSPVPKENHNAQSGSLS